VFPLESEERTGGLEVFLRLGYLTGVLDMGVKR
jgi:hypothetical protein